MLYKRYDYTLSIRIPTEVLRVLYYYRIIILVGISHEASVPDEVNYYY